jgi:hypothetical protein
MNMRRTTCAPLIFLFVCSALLFTCAGKPDPVLTAADSTARKDVKEVVAIDQHLSHTPTREFISLTMKIDSLGFRFDTTRVKKIIYGDYLHPKNIEIFDRLPFYRITNNKETWLYRWDAGTRTVGDSVGHALISEATSVWAYFYCDKKTSSRIEDGVIEQWEFSDEKTPRRILDSLISFYPLPYFNTSPFYLATGKYLYVFHTRANAFSFRQQEFFWIFEKNIMRGVSHQAFGEADYSPCLRNPAEKNKTEDPEKYNLTDRSFNHVLMHRCARMTDVLIQHEVEMLLRFL